MCSVDPRQELRLITQKLEEIDQQLEELRKQKHNLVTRKKLLEKNLSDPTAASSEDHDDARWDKKGNYL